MQKEYMTIHTYKSTIQEKLVACSNKSLQAKCRPGMGNQTWTSEKDCYNFAVGNGATFFQKAGSRCYVYGAGGSSGVWTGMLEDFY